MFLAQPLQCCCHVPNQWLASFLLIFANLFANCSCKAIYLSRLQYCGTMLQCCSQENIQFDCESDPMLKIAIRFTHTLLVSIHPLPKIYDVLYIITQMHFYVWCISPYPLSPLTLMGGARVHSVHKSAKISGVSLTNYNTIYS
jgi:hypothetical protein